MATVSIEECIDSRLCSQVEASVKKIVGRFHGLHHDMESDSAYMGKTVKDAVFSGPAYLMVAISVSQSPWGCLPVSPDTGSDADTGTGPKRPTSTGHVRSCQTLFPLRLQTRGLVL